MLEEILVGNHAPKQAPGIVDVLELVWIEDPQRYDGDARQKESDGRNP